MPSTAKVVCDTFHIGQTGEFTLLDAFHEPIETIQGRIIQLMDGKDSLYAMIETDRGVRPARLSPHEY